MPLGAYADGFSIGTTPDLQCVCRAFGLALHGVRHSKTPGIFGLWIEVALQLQECRVEAKVECNMALQGRTLRALEFLSGVRKFHSALRKLFVA